MIPRSIQIRPAVSIVLTIFMAMAAYAQSPVDQQGFTPVDQTVADISPLSASLQSLRPDGGPPQGYSRVYTHPDYPGKFLRVNGAVIVEFDESEYIQTEEGLYAEFPPNAIYWIGGKPDYLKPTPSPEPALKLSRYFVNTRTSTNADSLDEKAARERAAAEPFISRRPTVWSDEAYRQRSVERWLETAADVSG